ncbi:hypothetical protein BKI52_26285 [marine bacterium AO1-C]|nr:hypothetical protein BKI52_26285 [marine bacterium AO1-C]
METPDNDFVVVGSGMSGAVVAHTLVTAGARVHLLDVGNQDTTYRDLIPDKGFEHIRQEDSLQHEYFLGKQFEGVPWTNTRVGSQLTPPRQYITRQVEDLLFTQSDSFTPMESLAYGGLGSGWGLGCNVYRDQELVKMGLNPAKMRTAYQAVSDLVGVAVNQDLVRPYTLGQVNTAYAAPQVDLNSQLLLNKYLKKQSKYISRGFYMGQPAIAAVTQDQAERRALPYHNMDFYTDQRRSAFRPWILIDRLKQQANFQYQSQSFVTSFREENGQVWVNYLDTATREQKQIKARKLILATGAIGSARIVLRSLGQDQQLPIVCNPYVYFACIQPKMLGKQITQERTSLGQLALFYDQEPDEDVITSGIYSYSSLLLFRLMKEAPLNFKDSRILFQYLHSTLSVAGVHFADYPTSQKFLKLAPNPESVTQDQLSIEYSLSDAEQLIIRKGSKKIAAFLRSLRCFPLKKILTPAGASIHYGGTLPIGDTASAFSLNEKGLITGTQNVYVADSAGFRYLPSQGLSFTIMAWAYLVANQALKS